MSELFVYSARRPADARWVYDDPSGVPDWPLVLSDELREAVEAAAAREGLTTQMWLAAVISRAVLSRAARTPSPA
jgi:hypothetical protein